MLFKIKGVLKSYTDDSKTQLLINLTLLGEELDQVYGVMGRQGFLTPEENHQYVLGYLGAICGESLAERSNITHRMVY